MNEAELARERISKEMTLAETFRKQGNEGRARVCARRAVGIALVWYYESRKINITNPDVIELMKRVLSDSIVPDDVQQAAQRLSAKITSEFQYASSSDPLADARCIIDFVLKETGYVA
ncbi:MAG: hypothetical protein EPO24_10735 [Bacteroidetes bacterium]|nr:MAG: hypothetical protein EPO24_10735 [Bacteroidota bacterium]